MDYDVEIPSSGLGDTKTYDRGFKKPKFSKKQTNRKESCGDFKIFCKGLMKDSLITGFPEIADAASRKRRIMKLVVFLVCTAGFCYQTGSFLKIYFAYPTVVNKINVYSETLEAPALTICNQNRLKRINYCYSFPEHCETVEDKEDFCKKYPNYCPSSTIRENSNRTVYQVVKEEYRYNPPNSLEYLNAFAEHNGNILIAICRIMRPTGILQCKTPKIIQAQRNGFPYKCFSIGALWGEPNEDPQILTRYNSYAIVIDLQPENYFDPEEPIKAYVQMHHPRYQANPFSEGISLKSGLMYVLQVSVERRESLPAPYSSNCVDYTSMWKKNGGYGPLTREQCVESCQMKYFMEKYGCVGTMINFPSNFSVCRERDRVPPRDVNMRCSRSCSEPCKMDYYTLSFKEDTKLGAVLCRPKDIHCENTLLSLVIRMRQVEETHYKQEPKFQSIELFSYIGGYMGMWLGISFVSLFDFGEMTSHIIIYPFRKWNNRWRRRRKTTPHGEDRGSINGTYETRTNHWFQ